MKKRMTFSQIAGVLCDHNYGDRDNWKFDSGANTHCHKSFISTSPSFIALDIYTAADAAEELAT